MHFDWYQATIPAPADAVIQQLGQSLGAVDLTDLPGRHGYDHQSVLTGHDGGTLAVVQHGGNGDRPNVQGSGHDAPAVAEAIRAHWPVHAVTRCDVAEDFVGVRSFEELEGACRKIARQGGVKARAIVPDDPAEGRTYYVGSPKSEVSARLYDKTAERRAKLPAEAHADVPEGWTRLEVQVRPRKARRAGVALCPPRAVWGAARWSQELAREVFELELERIHAPRPPSRDEVAYGHFVAQWMPLLARLRGRWGSAEFRRRFFEDLHEAEKRNTGMPR